MPRQKSTVTASRTRVHFFTKERRAPAPPVTRGPERVSRAGIWRARPGASQQPRGLAPGRAGADRIADALIPFRFEDETVRSRTRARFPLLLETEHPAHLVLAGGES